MCVLLCPQLYIPTLKKHGYIRIKGMKIESRWYYRHVLYILDYGFGNVRRIKKKRFKENGLLLCWLSCKQRVYKGHYHI